MASLISKFQLRHLAMFGTLCATSVLTEDAKTESRGHQLARYDNMPQCPTDELGTILGNIHEVVLKLHPACEDELESLLTWLNPNETSSNHHMRPPALRLKDTIKKFVNQYYNNAYSGDIYAQNNKGPEFELPALLRHFYIYQVRIHFFTCFKAIRTFKDIQRLEKYYESPLKYIHLFQFNTDEWVMQRDGLRHYLLNRNTVFRFNIKERLKALIMEDEFEFVAEILDWINNAHGCISSTEILLDLIIIKITKFCEDHMTGVYTKRFLVMKTFNSFITKYWSQFSQLLGCPEDDHELTTIIYNCFEKQLIRIRTEEVFEIFVYEFPNSRPTILEMRKLFVNSMELKKLVVQFLSAFDKNIMNPSVTTVDALLAFVKSVKAFLILEPSGRYLHAVISFVRPSFQERMDLVIVLLYAILDLQLDELVDGSRLQIDAQSLNNLARELRDPEFGIESQKSHGSLSGPTNSYSKMKKRNSKSSLLYKEVLKAFLTWNPDPLDMIHQSLAKGPTMHRRGLLDILMEIFESKDFFLSEFLKLLTKRLLSLKFYNLDRNWSKCLQLLRKKFSDGNSASSIGLSTPGHGNDNSKNEDYSNINYIDVMLWDVKCSHDLCKKMHQVSGLDQRIFPKFISYLYWNCRLESSHDFEVSPALSQEFEKYCRVYSEIKPGRALKLCKDQGMVELELEFDDGRILNCEATLEQCAVIQQFDNGMESSGLTAEEISMSVKMDPNRARNALQFWIDKGVLFREGNLFIPLESRQGKEQIEDHVTVHSANSVVANEGMNSEEDNRSSKALSDVWPFIQGMLTNLGSLKVQKIHSFLKVTVPKEIGYSIVTQSQLEAYLNALVDEEKLACTTNGSYKLIKL